MVPENINERFAVKFIQVHIVQTIIMLASIQQDFNAILMTIATSAFNLE